MPTPTPYAIGAEWQTNGSADFLHLKDKGGTIVGWIDKDGFLQGTLANGGGSLQLEVNGTPNVDQSLLNLIAGSNITLTDDGLGGITIASSGGGSGIGFASGTTVVNSTGNTPANGFTLSDGAGQSTTYAPTHVVMSAPDNPGVIDFNSESAPTITIGNAATIGASTQTDLITPHSITMNDTATGAQAIMQIIGLPPAFSETDAAGNAGALGSPNGAGLILNGAGGTSITEDGTVPSTTWNDGAGNTTIVSADEIDLEDTSGNHATITAMLFSILDSNNHGVSASTANGGNITIGAAVAWTSGTGAPSGTPAIGSFYSRTDGTIGSSFYVYNGTAWAAIG